MTEQEQLTYLKYVDLALDVARVAGTEPCRWMLEDAPELGNGFWGLHCDPWGRIELADAFDWSLAPQGDLFWDNVCDLLRGSPYEGHRVDKADAPSGYLDYLLLAIRVGEIRGVYTMRWMLEEAPKGTDFDYFSCLSDRFLWEDSPQGLAFWGEVQRTLDEEDAA